MQPKLMHQNVLHCYVIRHPVALRSVMYKYSAMLRNATPRYRAAESREPTRMPPVKCSAPDNNNNDSEHAKC